MHQPPSIQLTQGYVARVDAEDFERINTYKWFAVVSRWQIRAARQYYRNQVYMHHEVLRIMPWDLKSKEVDHIDGDPLNNCKSNLRVVSHTENMRNRRKARVGVCRNWRVKRKPWMAYLDAYGKCRKYLGYYETKELALAAVEEAQKCPG